MPHTLSSMQACIPRTLSSPSPCRTGGRTEERGRPHGYLELSQEQPFLTFGLCLSMHKSFQELGSGVS